MNTTDRSCVIGLAEAQVGIPGPPGRRSVILLQCTTCKISKLWCGESAL
jgi:hypothetical protein